MPTEDEQISDAEWDSLVRNKLAEYHGRQPNISVTTKCDHIKGDWWLWHCEAEMPNGKIVEGTVQADGQDEGIAIDTFEKD